MKYRTIFKALKIQEEIVILQEIQELQDSVPRLPPLSRKLGSPMEEPFLVGNKCFEAGVGYLHASLSVEIKKFDEI